MYQASRIQLLHCKNCTCMYANAVVGNSEKSLVTNGVNKKSEWMKIIQPNIP